ASASTPERVRQALLRIEGMLDQIALGLVECGELARERARAALEKPTPGVVYAAARLALEAGARELAELCAQHAAAQMKHRSALNAALSHGAVSDPAVSRSTSSRQSSTAAHVHALLKNWLSAGPQLAPFAMRLAARSGVQLPAANIVAVLDALPEAAIAEAIAALDGLTLLGNPETHAYISRWQNSPHDALRRAWAEAELVLGGPSGRSNVSRRADQDPAIISSAAIAFEAGAVPALGEVAAALSGEEACWALGLLGDARALPRLLRRLSCADSAHAAAAALEVLLGVAPLTTRLEPDLDERAPQRQVPCVSVDTEDWQRLAHEVLARHPQGARLRAGQLASPAATLDLLERPHLAEPLRRQLALELSLRWKLPRMLDVRALLRQQIRCIAQLRAAPCNAEPGSWS
ncbi:MAG TPA: hypothetical protein VG963_32300, partial [Polyangiaceae bacterium]|nr:hypothetical protein [Polyangiaceae bacterium]